MMPDQTTPGWRNDLPARAAAEAALLNAIAVAASGQESIADILGIALDRLAELIAFTGGSIALVEGDELVIRAAIGPFVDQALGQRLPRGTGRSWQVIDTGEPYWSNNLQAEGAKPSTGTLGKTMRSFLAVPLSWSGRCYGLLEIDSTSKDAFRREDVDLLRSVAALLSGSIELARRYRSEVLAREQIERLIAERDEALEQAREALEARDTFLATAAHDLKTPIAALLGFTGLLQRRFAFYKPPIEQRDLAMLDTIFAQTQRLNRLVSALLDMGRIEAGRLTIATEEMDLRVLLELIVADFRPTVDRHDLILEVPDEPLLVMGDDLRLDQIFHNLLHNAIKYSPFGGRLCVRGTREGRWVCVAVSDEGIGIPAPELSLLFTRFYRAGNAGSISGMGLGLWIINELVRLHGGEIRVESVEGRGSTFSVVLPAAR